LAEYPVYKELPGVIGYFQVDADGAFTTPLLPPAGSEAKLGIPVDELANRRQLAAGIASVLVDNRLVRPGPVRIAESSVQAQGMASVPEEESFLDDEDADKDMVAPIGDAERDMTQAMDAAQSGEETVRRVLLRGDDDYSQQAFDELNSPSETVARPASNSAIGEKRQAQERAAQDNYAKLTDLKLDAALEKKARSPGKKRRPTGHRLQFLSRDHRPQIACDGASSPHCLNRSCRWK
jgi:hypothetical protein